MSEAPKDGASGLVVWQAFLPTAAMMVRGMIDPRAVEERASVARRANFEPVELMDGKDAQVMLPPPSPLSDVPTPQRPTPRSTI